MNQTQYIGKSSIRFDKAPYISNYASVVGKLEGEGPLGNTFDKVVMDPMFGGTCWEEAESLLQKHTLKTLLKKSDLKPADIRYIFAGDLLGQLIASAFGIKDFNIPFFGLYGACSTMGEALTLASMTIAAGFADKTVAMASSHFASAEKTFRFPLGYGCQRKVCATWTVTGCGAVVLDAHNGIAKVTGITPGKMVDFGVKESDNMGASMAPAAADTIFTHLTDFGLQPNYYDKIITGDLGYVGQTILIDLLKAKNIDISSNHMDCGIEIFDNNKQKTGCGGSGCGCSASTLCSLILDNISSKKWKRVLFVPTGALLSPISFNEGNSIPGIAHGVVIESI